MGYISLTLHHARFPFLNVEQSLQRACSLCFVFNVLITMSPLGSLQCSQSTVHVLQYTGTEQYSTAFLAMEQYRTGLSVLYSCVLY
jgi:hypothetical protein